MSWDSDTARTRIRLCARKSTHHQLSCYKGISVLRRIAALTTR